MKNLFAAIGIAALSCGTASALDLRQSRIAADSNLSGPEKKAVEMLTEEVEKRTALRWGASGSGPVITIHHARGSGAAEGFHLRIANGGVDIQGNDERGTLFGIGRLLRELRWDHQTADVADALDITSAPKYKLRGHQIGYRPKVNAYDAWTPAIFEQYLRDLIVFGTNAIELIPPRSDDDDDSPHFHLSKIDMMAEMSRICAEYGIDVWIWYPAMDQDYSDPKTVDFALKEWSEVYRRLPRIDAVFVPGGDPGHTQPKYLIALLEKQKKRLRSFTRRAQMWMSPQNFDAKWFDEYHRHHESRADMARWRGLRAVDPHHHSGTTQQNSRSLSDPLLSRHHPHDPRRVSRARMGRRIRRHTKPAKRSIRAPPITRRYSIT